MKKLTFIAIALVAMATTFTSCKKDTTNVAPVITFANIADSATSQHTDSDPYTLGITVTSDAGLSKVIIKETKGGTTSTKATITDFTDKLKYENQYAVTGIPTGGITVTVEATDKNDLVTSREILITKGSTGGALTTYSIAHIGAGGNATYGSYIDLDAGQVYGYTAVSTTPSIAALIDAVFNQSSLYNTGNGLSGSTGTIFGATTMDATSFAAATTASLVGLNAVSPTIAIIQGDVVYFETGASHKGLILIKTVSSESTSGANDRVISIDIKIQK
jgi:hypothetical protein